jgi:undecaprenyl-diphosphatase
MGYGARRACPGPDGDVLGSAALALPVAFLVSSALRRWAAPLVGSLSQGVLRPLLTTEPIATTQPARQAASAGDPL